MPLKALIALFGRNYRHIAVIVDSRSYAVFYKG
jgi:hypothetical protein